jgi:peptidoglycan hydrolase CwlO-like protein
MKEDRKIKELEAAVNSLQEEIKRIKSRIDEMESKIEDFFIHADSVYTAYDKRFPEDRIKEF